jgi:hypothetical protein
MSLVTECGTGKIYAIGATAPEFFSGEGATYAKGESTWSLYALEPGAPRLRHITNSTRSMHSQECDARAAGTAFVAKRGELALYCHQKARDCNQRASGIGCAAGAIGLFASAFPLLSTVAVSVFCSDTFNPDETRVFKEYMANLGTPEAPPVSTVPVTIQLSHDSNYGDILGVMGMDGQVCQVKEGAATATCTWNVQPGKFGLVPFYGESEHLVRWVGNCQASNLSGGVATTCTPNIYGATTFRLEGVTIF